LALLKWNLTQTSLRLKYVLLAGGLEILGNGFLKCWLVLLEQAAHPVKLLDSPSVAARDTCGEDLLLAVENTLKRI
jgi:hypothetical protein